MAAWGCGLLSIGVFILKQKSAYELYRGDGSWEVWSYELCMLIVASEWEWVFVVI